MKHFAIAYVATLTAFLIIDAIWLGLVAKRFYAEQLGDLMRPDILFLPAALFYLVYSAGIVLLAIRPEQTELSLINIALYGALVGFIAYGTYDVTNIATIRNWPLPMSIVDMVWGTLLTSAVAVLGALTLNQFR